MKQHKKTISEHKYRRILAMHPNTRMTAFYNHDKVRYVSGVYVTNKNGHFFYCKVLQGKQGSDRFESVNEYYARYNLKEIF